MKYQPYQPRASVNGFLYRTRAAGRYMAKLDSLWDNPAPYLLTVAAGKLCPADMEALREVCAATGDHYEDAASEVLALILNETRLLIQ